VAERRLNARVADGTFSVRTEDRLVLVQPDTGADPVTFETQYLGHGRVVVRRDDVAHVAWVVEDGDTRWVYADGEVTMVEVSDGSTARRTRRADGDGHAALVAPMPATVVRIPIAIGTRVGRGTTLVLLEAMKMELPLRAPHDGVVSAIHCKEGELVQPNVVLVELDAAPAS
jgi:biotin carboxyl carrier protein